MVDIAKSPAAYERWSEQAASGDRFSQLVAGLVHTQTEALGAKTNKDQGIRWLEAAARQGSLFSMKLLGNIYATEAWLSPTIERRSDLERMSAYWYKQGALLGDMDSERELGDNLSKGKGIEKDLPEAVRMWSLAADKGSRLAQWKLFVAYTEGLGIEPNLIEAVRWGTLASRKVSGVSIVDAPSRQRLNSAASRLSEKERVTVERAVGEWLRGNAASEEMKALGNEKECGIREFNKGFIR